MLPEAVAVDPMTGAFIEKPFYVFHRGLSGLLRIGAAGIFTVMFASVAVACLYQASQSLRSGSGCEA